MRDEIYMRWRVPFDCIHLTLSVFIIINVSIVVRKIVITLFIVSMLSAIGWQARKMFWGDQVEITFEAAKLSIENQQNRDFEYIISKKPEFLTQKDARGFDLIDLAIESYDDDGMSVTNFEAVNFIISKNFFGHDVDALYNLNITLRALTSADRQYSKIEFAPFLPEKYNRSDYLSMLSQFVLLTPDEKIEQIFAIQILSAVCKKSQPRDKGQFNEGDVRYLDPAAVEKIKHNFHTGDLDVKTRLYLFEVSAKAGTLNGDCLLEMLKDQ